MDAYFMIEHQTLLTQEQINLAQSLPSLDELKKTENSNTVKSTSGKIGKKKRKCCAAKGCKKKINLLSFTCKCEKVFCTEHRMPEEHQCTFDWKKHGQCLIAQKNPQVINSKITQI